MLWSVSLFSTSNFSIPLDYDLKKHIRIQRDKRTREELWRRWKTEQVIFGISKQFIGWADLSRAQEIWLQLNNDKAGDTFENLCRIFSSDLRLRAHQSDLQGHYEFSPKRHTLSAARRLCDDTLSLVAKENQKKTGEAETSEVTTKHWMNYIFNSVTFCFNASRVKWSILETVLHSVQ